MTSLRDLTDEFRKEILGSIEGDENEIKSLRENAEKEEDVYRKEEIYNEIDKIEKQINEKLEVVLDQVVPRAFAIVKETAKRFKENSVLKLQQDNMTGILLPQGKVLQLKVIKHFGVINGLQEEMRLPGIWFIMMFS